MHTYVTYLRQVDCRGRVSDFILWGGVRVLFFGIGGIVWTHNLRMTDNAEGQRKSLTFSPVWTPFFKARRAQSRLTITSSRGEGSPEFFPNGLVIGITETRHVCVCVFLHRRLAVVFSDMNIRLHLKKRLKLVLLVCASYVRPTRGSFGGPQRSTGQYVWQRAWLRGNRGRRRYTDQKTIDRDVTTNRVPFVVAFFPFGSCATIV